MDRRKVKTEKAIKGAFCALICQKKYADISVQDIIDEADIARATFYDHFKHKDEVLISISADIFAHITDEALHAEKHHDFSNKQDFSHRIIHMLYHLSEEKAVIAGILRSESHDIFLMDLRSHLRSLFGDKALPTGRFRDVPKELFLNQAVNTLTELTLWWIKENDCAYPPERVAGYYFTFMEE